MVESTAVTAGMQHVNSCGCGGSHSHARPSCCCGGTYWETVTEQVERTIDHPVQVSVMARGVKIVQKRRTVYDEIEVKTCAPALVISKETRQRQVCRQVERSRECEKTVRYTDYQHKKYDVGNVNSGMGQCNHCQPDGNVEVTVETPVEKYEKVKYDKPYHTWVTETVTEEFEVKRYEMQEHVKIVKVNPRCIVVTEEEEYFRPQCKMEMQKKTIKVPVTYTVCRSCCGPRGKREEYWDAGY